MSIEPLLAVHEVAEILRLDGSTVYRLIERRQPASVRIGRRVLVEPAAAQWFVAEHRCGVVVDRRAPATAPEAVDVDAWLAQQRAALRATPPRPRRGRRARAEAAR